MNYENIIVRELPEWLRHLIRKELAKRLARPEVERLMEGTLSEVNKVLGNRKDAYEKLAPIEKARFLIKQFCWKEYNSMPVFTDLGNIAIAYTENDECEPVQVYADLVRYRIFTTVNHKEVKGYAYGSLEELIDKELERLDYNLLVSDGLNYGKE